MERVYYIVFKKEGKVFEEKAGRQFADDMTPARAARIRAERIEGKRQSRKEIREAAAEIKWTVDRLWDNNQSSICTGQAAAGLNLFSLDTLPNHAMMDFKTLLRKYQALLAENQALKEENISLKARLGLADLSRSRSSQEKVLQDAFSVTGVRKKVSCGWKAQTSPRNC